MKSSWLYEENELSLSSHGFLYGEIAKNELMKKIFEFFWRRDHKFKYEIAHNVIVDLMEHEL